MTRNAPTTLRLLSQSCSKTPLANHKVEAVGVDEDEHEGRPPLSLCDGLGGGGGLRGNLCQPPDPNPSVRTESLYLKLRPGLSEFF